MKVLFISYDGMTDPLGQSQVIPYLIGLVKSGHEIHILSCEKSDRFFSHKKEIQSLLNENSIVWHPISYTKSPPVLSTFWDVVQLGKTAKQLHLDIQFDIVHCRSYISAIVGEVLKKKFGVKFLFDIRGFWVDERVDGNIWNRKNVVFNVIYKYFKNKERIFFEKADGIVTLTKASKDHILKNYDCTINITVIPCAADLELFCPQSRSVREIYRTRLELDQEFTLLYLGSIGTWYLLKEMLDFFLVLKATKKDARFIFLTADDPKIILSAAKKKGIKEQDIIIQTSTRSEVPRWLSVADLSIFFIKECFSKMASSPTKHGELLGAGVPVVCNDIGDLKDIVEYSNSGTLVKELDNKAYQQAIDRVLSLKRDAKLSKDTAVEFYDLDKGIKKYDCLYRSFK